MTSVVTHRDHKIQYLTGEPVEKAPAAGAHLGLIDLVEIDHGSMEPMGPTMINKDFEAFIFVNRNNTKT